MDVEAWNDRRGSVIRHRERHQRSLSRERRKSYGVPACKAPFVAFRWFQTTSASKGIVAPLSLRARAHGQGTHARGWRDVMTMETQ